MRIGSIVPSGGFARGFLTAAAGAAAVMILAGAQQGNPGKPGAPASAGNPGAATPWGPGPGGAGAQYFVTGDNTWATLWRLDPGAKKVVFIGHTKVDYPTSTVEPR